MALDFETFRLWREDDPASRGRAWLWVWESKYGLARAFLRLYRPRDAKELAEDALVTALVNLHEAVRSGRCEWRGEAAFESYVHVVIRNACMDVLRKIPPTVAIDPEQFPARTSAVSPADLRKCILDLFHALASLVNGLKPIAPLQTRILDVILAFDRERLRAATPTPPQADRLSDWVESCDPVSFWECADRRQVREFLLKGLEAASHNVLDLRLREIRKRVIAMVVPDVQPLLWYQLGRPRGGDLERAEP